MQRYVKPLVRIIARLALACAAIPLTLTAVELGYRIHSHRPVLALDDWRLERIAYRRFGETGRFDRALGWAPRAEYESDRYNTLGQGIRRNFSETGVRANAILAVGDVFTDGGSEIADDETWPAQLEQATGVPVLNAGVAGYATDQSVIRAEQLLPLLRPTALVVGVSAASIAQAGLSSFGVVKPYYTLQDGALVYHAPTRAVPGDDGLSGWRAEARTLLGHSAVLDVVLSRLVPAYWFGRSGEPVIQRIDNDPAAVTCALLERLKQRADVDRVRVLLLMQHARQAIVEGTAPGEDVRRVTACAAQMGVEVVDQLAGLRALASTSSAALDDLYLLDAGYGQMSPAGNRRAAEDLARALKEYALKD